MRAALSNVSFMIAEDEPTTLHSRYTDAPESPTTVSDANVPRVVVEVITRTYANRTFQLAYGTYRIGTQETCDLVIVDPWVSREHLEIEVTEHGVRFIDLGSTNGSYCDGALFDDLTVLPGSSITIGASLLRIRLALAPRPSFSRIPTQPGLAVAPTVRPFGTPPPRFATGSIPPLQRSWEPAPCGPGVVVVSAPQVASGELFQHATDWAPPPGRRPRKLVRGLAAVFVTSLIAACFVIAVPSVLDPLCDDYEWFGAGAADVVRHYAREAHSALAAM
jgi:pSer/pThr/pTyr-binding forkhead associated (FHA) protein